MIVAVDGPAGSGKGTLTKLVADKLNLQYIDTGAMYRCIALKMLEEGIGLEDTDKIKEILDGIEIDLQGPKVILNGRDVSKEIRTVEVANFTSPVSTIDFVRTKMVELQRGLGKEKDIIMEGRDIGTVVFPNADVKIYLDASAEERANRRLKQNKEKGINTSYEEILENIKSRDKNDKASNVGTFKQAEDAIYIDSTNLTIEEVTDRIVNIIKEKRKA